MLFNEIYYDIRARLGIDKMMVPIDTFSQPLIIVVCSNYFPSFISYLISRIAALNFTFAPSRCCHD